MNDRRTIVALLIIGVILLLMPTYLRWFYGTETPPGRPGQAVDTLMTRVPVDTLMTRVQEPRPARPGTGHGENVSGSESIYRAPGPDDGRTITVMTPLYSASVTTRGAVIGRWQLRNYRREGEAPVQMIPYGTRGPVLEVPLGDERINALEIIFTTPAADTIRVAPGEETTLALTGTLAGDRIITRVMRFRGDGYDVNIRDGFQGFTTTPVNDAYRLYWIGGLSFTEPGDRGRREDVTYSGFYGYQGGDIQKTRLKREHAEEQLFGAVDWVAIRTKYFTAAMVPLGDPFRTARLSGEVGEAGPPIMELAADRALPVEGTGTVETLLYLGPIDYSILREYEAGLEGMMDFGFSIIKPISKFVLNLFTFLHEYIHNYGLVLIIFSILVKLLVYPLTRKSYESMHAMQELTPRMQEIREKYKDDPEKMNKKVMNLYKENKVNPLGGCFPLLLQMPVFWALFIVFRTTIELRGAPFVLWITDLSMNDPLMVLPGLMSLTMLLQQRAQLKNPQQRTMAIMMPIMFFFLFKGFPAGLVLYWTLFNILSIIQTELVHKKPEPAGADSGKNTPGKNTPGKTAAGKTAPRARAGSAATGRASGRKQTAGGRRK